MILTLFLSSCFIFLFVLQVILAFLASAQPQGGSSGPVTTFGIYSLFALLGLVLIYTRHPNWAVALILFLMVADYYTIRTANARSGD